MFYMYDSTMTIVSQRKGKKRKEKDDKKILRAREIGACPPPPPHTDNTLQLAAQSKPKHSNNLHHRSCVKGRLRQP
jgi:hypothetical protein